MTLTMKALSSPERAESGTLTCKSVVGSITGKFVEAAAATQSRAAVDFGLVTFFLAAIVVYPLSLSQMIPLIVDEV